MAFSCGGVAALMAEAGWRVCVATVFTGSVVPAEGFALACQLDKGLGAEVDYMALRRGEDAAAAAALGILDVRWLGLLEAPHRGYGSAAALFGAEGTGDQVWREIAGLAGGLVAELGADVVLVPQGLGGHVDHRQVIRGVRAAVGGERLGYWRDAPYAMRAGGVAGVEGLPGEEVVVPIGAVLGRKIAAAGAYRSQVGFQFGGVEAVGPALEAFAVAEGGGVAAERFVGGAGALAWLAGLAIGRP